MATILNISNRVRLTAIVLSLFAMVAACSEKQSQENTKSSDGGKADAAGQWQDSSTIAQQPTDGSTTIIKDSATGTPTANDAAAGKPSIKDASTDARKSRDSGATDGAARDSSQHDVSTQADTKASVTIKWWVQSCFSSTAEGGITVMNDPYGSPTIEPQVCLISHEHSDHNAIGNVPGNPVVIRSADGVGQHEAAGITFKGVATYHDDSSGSQRGTNTVFVWAMEGIRFAHLGDLGHVLSDEQIKQIGQVDILMIPIGGGYSIDGPTAVQVAQQLSPKLILPMHYRTGTGSTFLATIDAFLEALPTDWTLEQPNESSVVVKASELKTLGTKVVVLKNQ